MAHTKVTKTYSQNTGAVNTFSYSGSFDVFKGTEVQAELDNVQLTFTASTINESASPREYTVDTSAKTIHIGGADLSSGTIIIRPVTDMGAPTPRATYAPGSSVTSEDLNNNQLQLMRKAMEYDEQKLSSIGGTMTGHLTMGEDQTIIFEGATDDGYETTLTVTDPTADRTITLPNVTGTVVTTGDTGSVATGMIAADAITGAKIADDQINSEHYAAGSIDTEHIANSQITSAKIADATILTADIADGQITQAKLANNDVVDNNQLQDNAVSTAKIVDANVTTAKIADANVTTAKITDLNVTTAKIAADAITAAKIADDVVNSEHYAAGSIDTEHIADLNVTTAKIAADAITGAKIADDAIDSEHYTDGSIDTAHIGGTQVTAAKIASNAVTTAKITDANVTTAKIADSNVTLAKLASDLKSTSISDSDTQLPTSGAVVDYVAAQIAPIGGLEVIATDAAFPNTQPSSGVVISIADAGGLVVNGSGTSTTGRTVGGSTVTINNIASNFNSSTVDAGVCFQVSSTGSGQIYNYHKATLKEADLLSLSNDINDFAARYRVQSGEPSSNNDAGDLAFDTAASKMKVYDGSSWGEVTSSGDFKYLVMTNAGTTNAATLNGSNVTFDLKETSTGGSAAAVTSAAQLMVSVNGVVQKPNTGTNPSGLDGFVMADSDTITFCAAPASGDDIFIIQTGSAITPTTPADGTVTAAKIGSGAVTTAKIADDAVTAAKIADDAVGAEHIEVLDANLQLADDSTIQLGTSNEGELYHNSGGVTVLRNTVDDTDLYIQVKQNSDIIFNASDTGGQKAAVFKWSDDSTPISSAELYCNDTKRFETTNTGTNVTGVHVDDGATHDGDVSLNGANYNSWWDKSDNAFKFDDNAKIKVGTGGDLQLYHNGSNSYLQDVGTGALYIDGSSVRLRNYANSETMAQFIGDGQCELYYDNSKKIETRSGGIGVFGHIEAGDDNKVMLGDSNDLELFHNGSNSKIHNNTGRLDIETDSFRVYNHGGSENMIDADADAAVKLYYNNGEKFETNSSGVAIKNSGDCVLTFSASNGGEYWYIRVQDDNFRFLVDASERMRISSGGNIGAPTGSNIYNASDQRLKKNITTLTNGLDKIKSLNPVSFNWIDGFCDEEKDQTLYGFIAQEAQVVDSNLVNTFATGTVTVKDQTIENALTVNEKFIIPLLIKAVQELSTEVETLKTKVAALEAK